VGIGLAIAFGALFVVGILAAIAIPVFLNERAQGRAAGTTVSTPEAALGWVRSDSTNSQQFVRRMLAAPMPGEKFAAVYETPTGQRRAALLVAKVGIAPAERAAFLRGARDSETRDGASSFRDVEPGPLGGVMQCGSIRGAGVTVCNFADEAVVGTITLLGTSEGDALAVQLREAVEHRS